MWAPIFSQSKSVNNLKNALYYSMKEIEQQAYPWKIYGTFL